MKMRKMNGKLNNKAFSLIELIIIIAILAILIAIIVPSFIKYVKKTQKIRDVETARVMGSTLERIISIDPQAASEWYGVDRVLTQEQIKKGVSHVEYTVPMDGGGSYEFSNVFEYAMTKEGEIAANKNHTDWKSEKNFQNGIIRDARKDCSTLKELMNEELSSDYYTIAYRENDLRIFRVGKNLSTGGVEVWACIIPQHSQKDGGGLSDGLGVTNGRITYKLYPETDPKYFTDTGDPTSINAHR